MLLAVWCVEAGIACHELRWKAVLPSDWEITRRAASGEATRAEVLCFGDSQVKHGVLPSVITGRTGRSAYNLALNRGQAPGSYFLLRKALRSGARPKAIVVGFHSGLLATQPSLNAAVWPDLLGASELCELSWEARDPVLAARLLFGWLVPSTRHREEVRAAVLAALRGEVSDPSGSVASLRRGWLAHRGAQVNPKDPGFLDPAPRPTVPWQGVYWRCTRVNRVYVRRFLGLAASRGIPVYWLMPPWSPAVRADIAARGVDAAYERFVGERLADHPGLRVVDGRGVDYDRTYFIDQVHLDGDGATAFSAEVAPILGDVAPQERWSRLPRDRDRDPSSEMSSRDTDRGGQMLE